MPGKRTSMSDAAKKTGGSEGASKVKLGIAIVGLLGGAGLLMWHFGIFDNPNKPLPKPPPLEQVYTPEQIKDQQKVKAQKAEEAPRRPPASGS